MSDSLTFVNPSQFFEAVCGDSLWSGFKKRKNDIYDTIQFALDANRRIDAYTRTYAKHNMGGYVETRKYGHQTVYLGVGQGYLLLLSKWVKTYGSYHLRDGYYYWISATPDYNGGVEDEVLWNPTDIVWNILNEVTTIHHYNALLENILFYEKAFRDSKRIINEREKERAYFQKIIGEQQTKAKTERFQSVLSTHKNIMDCTNDLRKKTEGDIRK